VPDDAEVDQLEGPNGWKPRLQDFDHLLTSTLVEVLPLERKDHLSSNEELNNKLDALLQKVASLQVGTVGWLNDGAPRLQKETQLDHAHTSSVPAEVNTLLDLQCFQVSMKPPHFRSTDQFRRLSGTS
jgi:hypothetical protein